MIALDETYDAAFDRCRFPRLIQNLCAQFAAGAGFLGWSDLDRGGGFHVQHGNDPVWLQRYVEVYAEIDVMRPHLQALDEGECTTAWALLQTAEIRDSRFYREYLAPQGIVDNLAVNLVKRPEIGLFAHFALLRFAPAEPFTEAERQALAALVPHLRRAVLIQSRLLNESDRAAASRLLSGGGSDALLLLDVDGRVIDADAELRDGCGLRIGERLDDGALGSGVGKAIRSGKPVAIEIARGEATQRLLIEARKLDRRPLADLTTDAVASHLIHVVQLDQPVTIAFDAFADFYQLTPTEARVFEDAIEHGDLSRIGERLGMATATARSHLHRIYQKTGTGSFAKLASLAYRFRRILNG